MLKHLELHGPEETLETGIGYTPQSHLSGGLQEMEDVYPNFSQPFVENSMGEINSLMILDGPKGGNACFERQSPQVRKYRFWRLEVN